MHNSRGTLTGLPSHVITNENWNGNQSGPVSQGLGDACDYKIILSVVYHVKSNWRPARIRLQTFSQSTFEVILHLIPETQDKLIGGE